MKRICLYERTLWNMARLAILGSLFYVECFVSKLLFGSLRPYHCILAVACFLIGGSLFAVGCISKDGERSRFSKPKWDLITNFFENTVGAGFIIPVLMLWFLMHLELMYNAASGLLLSDLNEGPAWKYLCVVAVIALSIYLSLFLYPHYSITMSPEDRSCMITPLSLSKVIGSGSQELSLTLQNVDLLLKPFTAAKLKLKRMVVIPSANDIIVGKDWKPFYKDYIVADVSDEEKKQEFDRVVATFDKEKVSDIKEVIEMFLPLLTLDEEVKEAVEGCEFLLELPTDYDDFVGCVGSIDRVMKKYEKDKETVMKPEDTLLYISPGTGAIGSALASFAIPGARMIAYFPQNGDNKKMKFFDVRVSGINRIYAELAQS